MKTSRLACLVLALLQPVHSPAADTTPPAPAPAAPAPAAPTRAAPAPAAPARAAVVQRRMVVKDGQLISHYFTVFITHPITANMNPVLNFTASHLVTKPGSLENHTFDNPIVAPHQHRVIDVNGVALTLEGTVLMYNLAGHKIEFYKSAQRVLPIISWQEPAATAGQPAVEQKMIAEDEMYLGNMIGSTIWTLLVVLIIVGLMLVWSWRKAREITAFKPRPSLLLITGSDGYLSLWRTQLLAWTLAVGAVVLLFGLLKLHVPEIPETLVALMGMSLLTGAVSSAKAKKDTPNQTAAAAPTPVPVPPANPANPKKAEFADLISAWNAKLMRVELSVPKAQMVFWTIIVLFLFIVKSILLGALWPVPWEMVALTGMSQLGYIGDKYVQSESP
jgi:hypothetical protein